MSVKKIRTIVLGTARNDFVKKALKELQKDENKLYVLVKHDRFFDFRDTPFNVRQFKGDISWKNFAILRILRRIKPDQIVIVVGDQFLHNNVAKALSLWISLRILNNADVYVSYSYDPAFLEYWGSVDTAPSYASALLFTATITLVGYFILGLWWLIFLLLFFMFAELTLRRRKAQVKIRNAPECDLKSQSHEKMTWERVCLPITTPDPELGWKTKAVDLRVTVTNARPKRRVSWRCVIDRSGARMTCQGIDKNQQDKAVIAIYGSGATFGEALSDQETFSWLLQKEFPEFRVKNYGTPGYSLYQMYLSHLRKMKTDRPAVVIVELSDEMAKKNLGGCKWPFYGEINIAPGCRVRRGKIVRWRPKSYLHLPTATKSKAIKYLERLLNQIWLHQKIDETEIENITDRLLIEYKTLCEKNGAAFIVFYPGEIEGARVGFLNKQGFNWTGFQTNEISTRPGSFKETQKKIASALARSIADIVTES